jgi:outer membrane protein assembly factor BamB
MPDIPSYRERANAIQGSGVEVDTAGRRVFVGSADHHLYCLRAGTGEILWRLDTGAAVRSTPLFMEETQVVFFGNDDGELWAASASDGERRWVFQAEAEIAHEPLLIGEALYITTADNRVHAIDWTNGETIWSYEQPSSEAEFEVTGFAGPAVENGVLYTGFSSGRVVALDASDGDELWIRDISEDLVAQTSSHGIPVMPDVDTTPLLGRHSLVVASYDGGVYSLDKATGNVNWREPLRGVVGLSGHGQTIFAAQAGVGMVALDLEDGSVRWERRLGPAIYYRPYVFRDLVIVTDSRRGITAMRLEDGNVMQRYTVGAGAGAAPTVIGSTAFVMSNGGVVAALRIH